MVLNRRRCVTQPVHRERYMPPTSSFSVCSLPPEVRAHQLYLIFVPRLYSCIVFRAFYRHYYTTGQSWLCYTSAGRHVHADLCSRDYLPLETMWGHIAKEQSGHAAHLNFLVLLGQEGVTVADCLPDLDILDELVFFFCRISTMCVSSVGDRTDSGEEGESSFGVGPAQGCDQYHDLYRLLHGESLGSGLLGVSPRATTAVKCASSVLLMTGQGGSGGVVHVLSSIGDGLLASCTGYWADYCMWCQLEYVFLYESNASAFSRPSPAGRAFRSYSYGPARPKCNLSYCVKSATNVSARSSSGTGRTCCKM
jgi:hypothetical protein